MKFCKNSLSVCLSVCLTIPLLAFSTSSFAMLCGNGVLNKEYEQCDPKDPNKLNWGTDGCSITCKPKNKPHDECDQVSYNKLRLGYQYTLGDAFINTGNNDLKMDKFFIQSNFPVYPSAKPFPEFNWTSQAKKADYIVRPSEKVPAIKSVTNFHINYHLKNRAKDNGLVKYVTRFYARDKGEFDYSVPYYYNSCQYYEVTSCGDGIVDDYIEEDTNFHVQEQCDPADPNKQNWGSGGCSKTCKVID